MAQACKSCGAGRTTVRTVDGRRYSGCTTTRCAANAAWRAAERREQARLRAAARRRPARSPQATHGSHYPLATNPIVLLIGGAFFIGILALLSQH